MQTRLEASSTLRTDEVMIDGFGEEGLIDRSQHEAPEVDGVFFLTEFEDAVPGDRYDVQINAASDSDFLSELGLFLLKYTFKRVFKNTLNSCNKQITHI